MSESHRKLMEELIQSVEKHLTRRRERMATSATKSIKDCEREEERKLLVAETSKYYKMREEMEQLLKDIG